MTELSSEEQGRDRISGGLGISVNEGGLQAPGFPTVNTLFEPDEGVSMRMTPSSNPFRRQSPGFSGMSSLGEASRSGASPRARGQVELQRAASPSVPLNSSILKADSEFPSSRPTRANQTSEGQTHDEGTSLPGPDSSPQQQFESSASAAIGSPPPHPTIPNSRITIIFIDQSVTSITNRNSSNTTTTTVENAGNNSSRLSALNSNSLV